MIKGVNKFKDFKEMSMHWQYKSSQQSFHPPQTMASSYCVCLLCLNTLLPSLVSCTILLVHIRLNTSTALYIRVAN